MTGTLEPVARAICDTCGYAYVRMVGEGAFKETFEVTDGDIVHALKVFRSQDGRAERVKREVEAMLRCNHPNIAKLRRVDAVSVDGGGEHLYVLEEFLGGGTLGDRVKARGLLSRGEGLAIGELLVDAIGHIEERDLVHRDIKLENIMLRQDGETPVLVDFGIVRSLRDLSLTPNWAAQGPGTPFFAPAEQLCNDKEMIDWRADQFSLGVSLAMAVLGRHPYQEEKESPADVVERVATRRESVSTEFSRLASEAGMPALVRMVAPWPVQRFRTPDALSAAWRLQREQE